MKSKIFTFAAVMSVICFAANQCVWTGSGTGGWSDAANWKDGLVPVAGDTVQAEGENSITIGDDDVALASSIATINIVGASSSAVIDISGDAELKCQIKGDGCIVKRGAGSVIIAASLTEYDYYTTKGVRIEEGFFGFPRTEEPIGGDRGTVRLGPVYVAKGAFFGTHACPQKSSNTIIESLEGEGVVTNTTTAAGPYQLRINGNANKIFDGQINGNIRIYSAGTYVLRGTASRMKGSSMLNGATCSVYSFGVVNGPSSIGQNFEVWSREAGGEYIYCGEGETTDKVFCFYDAQCKNKGHIINGGSNGGLIWKGEFADRRTTDAGWCDRLILSGDNRVPCEITGPFTEGSGRTFSSITKKGTGTWILRHHASRNNHGVICVDNGTLQFESIAETNNVCSLGLSTGWYSNTYTGATNDDKTVHYAIRLGDSGTTGTLEYIGAERTYCSTRPIAVKGRGKIKIAEGAGDMSLTGFCTADSSGGTLVVDIPDGNSISLAGIADGKGVLSLEKTGAGKLNLRRDSSFTGAIAVKEGSVKIFDTRYRWYRFTVMDKYPRQPTDTGFDNNVSIQEFALYDDDGTCHTDGMKFIVTYKPEEVSNFASSSVKNYYAALEENSATWAMNGESYNYYTERDGDKLFDNRSNNNGCCVNFSVMDFSDPETWVKFVIRVGEDVPEITSYDFVFGTPTPHQRAPKSWKFEGSVDGIKWDELHSVIDDDVTRSGHTWMSDQTAFVASATRTGVRVNPRSEASDVSFGEDNVISVAEGAVFETDVGTVISSLSLDPAGNGTLRGFTLDSAGTISLAAKPTSEGLQLPVNFDNVDGIAGAKNWGVKTGDETLANFKVVFTETSVKILPIGTLIYLR